MSQTADIRALADYIVQHHKTHLIFDFDGTLAYLDFPWHEWGADIREEFAALDAEFLQRGKWPGNAPSQNLLVEQRGDPALRLLHRYNPEFEMRYSDKIVPNDPLMQQVAQLKEHYHLLLWTSNTRQLVDFTLSQSGMADWFEKIVTRNDVRFLKPYPEGFEHLRDPDVPKSRYLLIGDSSHDRKAAGAAGIDCQIIDFFNLGR